MTFRSFACGALLACATVSCIWTYGCKGNLGDDEVTTTFKKRYTFVRSGRAEDPHPREIDMDCVDYQLTAP